MRECVRVGDKVCVCVSENVCENVSVRKSESVRGSVRVCVRM